MLLMYALELALCELKNIVEFGEVTCLDHPVRLIQYEELQRFDVLCQMFVL